VDNPALFGALSHALKAIDSGVKVFGVQAHTISEAASAGTASPPQGPTSLRADRVVTVSGDQLRSAAAWILSEHRMALSPAGVAAIAYLLSAPGEIRGRRVAALIPAGDV
jgi:threonine dehydratase